MASVDTVYPNLANETADLHAGKADAGAGSFGRVVLKDAGDVVLSTILLQNPAFGAAVAGVASALGLPLQDGAAAATGVAVTCEVQDTDGVAVSRGTVTQVGGGGFAEIDNVNITSGDVVTLNALQYIFDDTAA